MDARLVNQLMRLRRDIMNTRSVLADLVGLIDESLGGSPRSNVGGLDDLTRLIQSIFRNES